MPHRSYFVRALCFCDLWGPSHDPCPSLTDRPLGDAAASLHRWRGSAAPCQKPSTRLTWGLFDFIIIETGHLSAKQGFPQRSGALATPLSSQTLRLKLERHAAQRESDLVSRQAHVLPGDRDGVADLSVLSATASWLEGIAVLQDAQQKM